MTTRGLALMGAVILVLVMLTGCGAAPDGYAGNNAGNSTADEATADAYETSLPAENRLTADELKPVMTDLIKSATVVWGYFTCGGCPVDSHASAPGKEEYFLVTAPGLTTMESLRGFVHQSFTPACAQRNFFAYIGEDVEYSAFLEIDGRLYARNSAKGWPYEYDVASLAILRQEGDTVTVSVDRLCFEQPEGKSVFVLKETADGWLLDNSFTESAKEEYVKLLDP